MGAFRFGLAYLDYLPTLNVGAVVVADRPVANLELYLQQFRTWRSATTSTTDKQVICDFTTVKTVRHVQLLNCNFSSVQIEVADNTGFSTNYFNHGPFAVNRHGRNGRRNLWVAIAGPLARRYVRITPSTIVGSATYFEIGYVAFFDGITEPVSSPGWPNRYIRRQAQTRIGYASGGEDVSEEGPVYIELTIAKNHWPRLNSTVQSQLFDILDAGLSGAIAIHENLGDSSATYVMRRVDDVEFQEQFVTFDASITFRESI